ncbi:cytochrome P450 [Aldersonia sp. NBC_00410]|uniref:cytochrome P450 n=1 Tax=Aldersonia sp. NBC_00410 TaxID=2975954 RepID=UPI0022531382|nr:cytochrome P450 [Aldersonia sp. NBC_00410]MCX5044392.1 cytochrome P450 [Aldersonia sp. NBC_00410]
MVTAGHRPHATPPENARLVGLSRDGLVDRVLHAIPNRTGELAAPPQGSGLRPVPGDRGLPILGHGLSYLRWGPAQQLDVHRRSGPVSYSKPMFTPTVFVCGPEATAVVVANKDKAFGQGWDFYIGPFFKRGLLLLEFDEHMFHRRLMQQAFTRPRLEGYVEELARVTDAAVGRWPTDRTVELYPTIKALTLDVAADIFMDADVGIERQRLNDAFMACTHAALAYVRIAIPGGKWRAGVNGRKVLEEYFYRQLPAKRASSGNDFFAALCHAVDEDGNRFSDEDVVNHMIFLIMAAHDTTTTTATTVAYYLGKHPAWQQRVREESLARGDGPIDIATLESMTALELVVKESMRLVAPVPGLVRRSVHDTEILGHYIPKGVLVDVGHWVNHLLPEYWTRPEVFDPDRFAEPRREDKSHKFAWMPFGAGAHKCIGMHFGMLETKAIIDAMVRHYEWRLPADYEVPWSFTTIPYPRDGAPVVLRRRG